MCSSSTPLAVGTRGTVGYLVRREIDYFRRLDLVDSSSTAASSGGQQQQQETCNSYSSTDSNRSSRKRSSSSAGNTILGSQLLKLNWRWSWSSKKKRRVNSSINNGFVNCMCTAVDDSETKRFDAIPGFGYQNLKDGQENLRL